MAEVLTRAPASPLPPQTGSLTRMRNNDDSMPVPGTACGPYGKRLAVQVLDELAERDPQRVWATITKSAYDIDEGFKDITFRQLADAVNKVSWQNEGRFGRSTSFGVIAYLGVSDVRYAIYMFAAIKTGHQLMIPSVRNSLSQHLAVFEEANCDIVYYTPEMKTRIKELQRERPQLQAYCVENLDDHIQDSVPHYKYGKEWSKARTDPILIAHSSGSTGNPKPTTITNGVYSVYDSHRMVPPIPGRRIQSYQLLEFDGGGRFFNPFPPFHLAGLFAMTIMPIFYTCTVTMGPPEKPPSGEILSKAMKHLKIRAAWCPPTVIEQLVALPGGFEQAATLDWIMYTGGPLAPAVGDRLCHVTDVCQLYGSTETGPHIAMVPLPGNWNYFEWHPLLKNEMEPMGDGTYEMVVYKDQSLDWIRHLSQAYPELEVWRTNDLFVQSPDNPELWRFTGRRDDVLVLSNGEKFNPVNMEGTVTGHPLVRGALIVGTARFQASLIVEPAAEVQMPEDEFIDYIWPTIEEANKVGPAHGRIFRSKVMVAKPDKPFKRAGKGTVIRGQTTKLYADEIDQVYRDDGDRDMGAPKLTSPDSLDAINDYVRACLKRLLPSSSFEDNDDLFVLGMDSLQTAELSKSLQRCLAIHLKEPSFTLTASHIYICPTVRQLTQLLYSVLNNTPLDFSAEENDRATQMASMLKKYTSDLSSNNQRSRKGLRVAVTGTTGSLGSYILETLIRDDSIERVYCLNRDANARRRHDDDFRRRGRQHDLASSSRKVDFMKMSPGEPNLGLSDTDRHVLINNVDAVIHNAWKVNFNHKLPSFEPHIKGVRDLVDLSLESELHPHIFFVSSLSSVGNWEKVRDLEQTVPEEALDDFNLALLMGYGESKHISERILTHAVKETGIHASILRVGQVAGPLAQEAGEWHKTEWMPSLIKTSKAMGCLPDSMNTVDWIPVDSLSSIINEIVQNDCSRRTSRVYNLVNSHVAKWEELVSAVQEEWKPAETRIVPFTEWLATLKSQDPDPEKFPALKILEFYEGLAADAEACKKGRVMYETGNGREVSRTMSELRPIDAEAMRTWLRQWNF